MDVDPETAKRIITDYRDVRHVPVPDGGTMSTDVQHQVLQDHMRTCDHCKHAIVDGGPRALGQVSYMCSTYQELIRFWSDGVGIE